jgi:hypothetical protein
MGLKYRLCTELGHSQCFDDVEQVDFRVEHFPSFDEKLVIDALLVIAAATF